jgi:hypothetical protein
MANRKAVPALEVREGKDGPSYTGTRAQIIAAGILFLFLAGACMAGESYFTVGLGKGYLRNNGENMWWQQTGWDHYVNEKSNVYRIGLGYDLKRWLAVELNYHDLGTYEHFAGFVIPEQQYNAATENCVAQCPNTRWGYLWGSAYSYSLTLIPSWHVTDNLSLFGRFGYQRYHARFKAYVFPE